MLDLATRAMNGDSAARSTLRRATGEPERRLHVPEVLRTDGALWRDSVLTAARIPAVSSYDLEVVIDQRWLIARLAALALIAAIVDSRFRRKAVAEGNRDGGH